MKTKMTNERRTLTDCLMSGGLERVKFRYNGSESLPPTDFSYEYTVKSIGRGRDGLSLWIDTPSDVETGSQEKRVSLYYHLCDIAIG